MRRAAWGVVLLAAAGGLACGTPQKELEESRRALRSWSATVAELRDGWDRRLLPSRFVLTALDAADEEIEKTSKKLRKTAAKLPAAGSALSEAAELEQESSRLRQIVNGGQTGATSSLESFAGSLARRAPPIAARRISRSNRGRSVAPREPNAASGPGSRLRPHPAEPRSGAEGRSASKGGDTGRRRASRERSAASGPGPRSRPHPAEPRTGAGARSASKRSDV